MLITCISIHSLRVPLKEPFIISLGPLHHAENVVVKMESSNGRCGWGECSPFRTIHGESNATCMSVGRELAGQLVGKDIDSPDQLLALLDKLYYGNTSIKSAFDIAFHDLLARNKEMPLYRLLGGGANRTLFTDYTVSLAAKEKMADDARWIVQQHFPVIKVKLGGTPREDIERIRAIRAAAGPDIPIRIDANQGWSVEGALEALHGLATFNIQHCEEPLPRWQYSELPHLRSHSTIPIMADESCCDENDAAKLILLNACDGINIKLGKSSGIVRATRIAALAENAGKKIQVGGFLESRLGFSASAHFALAQRGVDYIDFDTPLMFTEDPIIGGIKYGKNGAIEVPEAPGLGAELLPEFEECGERIVVG